MKPSKIQSDKRPFALANIYHRISYAAYARRSGGLEQTHAVLGKENTYSGVPPSYDAPVRSGVKPAQELGAFPTAFKELNPSQGITVEIASL
jgi:hypothetical protein